MDGYIVETGPDGVQITPSKLPGILELHVNGEDIIAYISDDMQLTLVPEVDDPSAVSMILHHVQLYVQQHPEFGAIRTEAALVKLNQAKIIKVGDSLIDADTGEWIADAHWGFDSDIKSLADVVTFMSRLSASDAVYAAHLQQREAVIKQMDAILKRDEQRRAYYAQWFPRLREWAADNKPPKKQTIDTPWGAIKFRKASFDVKVELAEGVRANDTAAVAWCESIGATEAVKTEKSILIGALNDALKDDLKNTKVPQELFEFVHGEESCTVDTGFGKVGSKDVNHKIEAPKPEHVYHGHVDIPGHDDDMTPELNAALQDALGAFDGPPPVREDPLGDD